MSTFVIHTHGRLQEWIAEEKGYFKEEGLHDYVLKSHGLLSADQQKTQSPAAENKYGAYQSYEQGRDASVSCALLD